MFHRVLLLALFCFASHGTASHYDMQDVVTRVLQEQPESIQVINKEKAYLCPERIQLFEGGIFLVGEQSAIPIPALFSDGHGFFVPVDASVNVPITCRNCGFQYWYSPAQYRCPNCGFGG